MIGRTDEQQVSNSINGLYPHGTHDRARYHEHHLDADKHVAINSVAAMATKRRGAAGDVRFGLSKNERGGRTKSVADFFQDNRHYLILDDKNNNGKIDAGEPQEARDIQADYQDVTLTASSNPSFLPRGTASNLASITLTNSAEAPKKLLSVSPGE
jgi:hypothetical protein